MPVRGWTLEPDGLGSIQARPLTSCGTLGKFFKLYVPLFLHLSNNRIKQVNICNSLRLVPVRANAIGVLVVIN